MQSAMRFTLCKTVNRLRIFKRHGRPRYGLRMPLYVVMAPDSRVLEEFRTLPSAWAWCIRTHDFEFADDTFEEVHQ